MPRTSSVLSRFLKRSVLGIGLVCLAIVAVTLLLAERNARTYTILYRLVPDGGQPESEALPATAAMLRQRLQTLGRSCGLRDWQVNLLPGGRLKLAFRTRRDAREALFWVTMPGRVEFRLLHPERPFADELPPGEVPAGYEVKSYNERLYRLSRPGALVTRKHAYLMRKEPALRLSRLADVSLQTVGWHKKTVLTFTFTEAEGKRFRDLTAQNVGRQLALLVDGRLFVPPRQIQGVIQGGAVQIQGYFYNPPLRRLVEMLRLSPLPCRLEELSRRVE